MTQRLALRVAVVVGTILSLGGPAAAATLRADFNGDGCSDLAIGVMAESVGGTAQAGAVNVLYGSPAGVTAAGAQLWTQDSPGVPGALEKDANFGSALATADFNGDGFSDLAIGVPRATVGGVEWAGAVIVLYGSASGLTSAGSQRWTQGTSGVSGAVMYYDQFGATLAAGDFDGDGRGDLAIGVPNDDPTTGGHPMGGVNVLYGSSSGLSPTRGQHWTQDSPGVPGAAAVDAEFGRTLAAGDFNGDGRADLAISSPYQGLATAGMTGTVNILYGSATGLTSAGSQLWSQDSPGVPGTAENSDFFGYSLATGDFDGDGRADLAVGVVDEMVGSIYAAGAVNVLYGSASGLSAAGSQLWDQDSAGVLGTAEMDDSFGSALAAGDFDGDGRVDLAVGVSGESVNGLTSAGAVNVLYGAASGLTSARNQLWDQNSAGIFGSAEENDQFGDALAAADFDGDGRADLAVGVRGETVNGATWAGAVNLLYGSASGLTSAGNQSWTQETAGVPGTANTGDAFGCALAGR